jgi:hypothetical protein
LAYKIGIAGRPNGMELVRKNTDGVRFEWPAHLNNEKYLARLAPQTDETWCAQPFGVIPGCRHRVRPLAGPMTGSAANPGIQADQIKNIKASQRRSARFRFPQEVLTLFTAALRQCLSYSRRACSLSRIKSRTSNSDRSRVE